MGRRLPWAGTRPLWPAAGPLWVSPEKERECAALESAALSLKFLEGSLALQVLGLSQVPSAPAGPQRPAAFIAGPGTGIHWELTPGLWCGLFGVDTTRQAWPPRGWQAVTSVSAASPFLSRIACLLQVGDPLGDGGSTLDFMAMKSYSDVSLDISVLGCLGRLCRVPPGGQGGSSLPIGRTMKTRILRTPQVTPDGACPALLSDLRPHPWESSAGVPPPLVHQCAHHRRPRVLTGLAPSGKMLVCRRGPPSPSWPVVSVARLLPSPFRPAGRAVRALGGLAQGSPPGGLWQPLEASLASPLGPGASGLK